MSNDVRINELPSFKDSRGEPTEDFPCKYFHIATSNKSTLFAKAGVLRGVRIHNQHTDYLSSWKGAPRMA